MKTLAKADLEAQKAADAGTFGIDQNGRRTFRIGSQVIAYFGNGGNTPAHHATNFYVRHVARADDLSSDYFAGTFQDTLTGAIRFARRMIQHHQRAG